MSYLKPRITLGVLLVTSIVGVYLAWLPTSVSTIVPVASWLVIVAFGVVLGSSLLRTIAATYVGGVSTQVVSRRWNQLDRIALGTALVGTALRLLTRPRDAATGSGILVVLAGVAVLFVIGIRSGRVPGRVGERRQAQMLAGVATLGLVGLAWGDVSIQGGATVDILVRMVHLWAVGLWIGAAVWHNTVVVPALKHDALAAVRPIVRRFQRFVPVLVLGVLVTGLYQATTWLGTQLSVYTTTSVGQLVTLKLLLLVVIAGFIGITHHQTPVTAKEG